MSFCQSCADALHKNALGPRTAFVAERRAKQLGMEQMTNLASRRPSSQTRVVHHWTYGILSVYRNSWPILTDTNCMHNYIGLYIHTHIWITWLIRHMYFFNKWTVKPIFQKKLNHFFMICSILFPTFPALFGASEFELQPLALTWSLWRHGEAEGSWRWCGVHVPWLLETGQIWSWRAHQARKKCILRFLCFFFPLYPRCEWFFKLNKHCWSILCHSTNGIQTGEVCIWIWCARIKKSGAELVSRQVRRDPVTLYGGSVVGVWMLSFEPSFTKRFKSEATRISPTSGGIFVNWWAIPFPNGPLLLVHLKVARI